MWLRIDRGDYFPAYQNDDGLFYVWAGNSILDNFFHPTSLTIFDTDNTQLFWRSQYRNIVPVDQFGFRLTDPWFDHPFFASIVIALPARLLGYRDFSQIPHMVVRIPAFAAAFFSMLLTYLLASTLFSKRVGIVAVAMLACWPLAVFSSRQSYIENIMTPFWLLSLLLTYKSIHQKPKRWYLPLLLFCDVFLAWSKVIGYISFAITAYWFMEVKKYKTAVIVGICALVSFLLYLGYGNWIGGSYFWDTLLNQSGRGSYVTSIFDIIRNPNIYGLVEDGWWFIGWFALFWLAKSKSKPGKFIVLNVIFWMVALFMLVGQQNNSPWYRYPIYPLLALAAGQLLVYWWKTADLVVGGVLLMLGLTGFRLAHVDVPSPVLRVGILGFMGTFVLIRYIQNKRLSLWIGRVAMILFILTAVAGNVLAIRKYPLIVCKDHNCTTPIKIDVTKPNL